MSGPDDSPDLRHDEADRALWQRSRECDAAEDESGLWLDLAAFAEGRIEDDDDLERVAIRLATDPDAAADAATARLLADGPWEEPDGYDALVARAAALVADRETDNVVVFAPRPWHRRVLPEIARWGSLAAALVLTGWLGFALGTDASISYSRLIQPAEDSFAPELLDPATGFLLRDFSESAAS